MPRSASVRASLLALLFACVPVEASVGRPPQAGQGPSVGESPRPARKLPVLDREPLLRVLIAEAPRVALQLHSPARIHVPGVPGVSGDSGRAATLPAGTFTVEARGEGWRFTGGPLAAAEPFLGPAALRSGGRPLVSVDAVPLFGAQRKVRLTGDLIVRAARGKVLVIEELPMEHYLVGVVAAEMNVKWPDQALAAQAIVARSYAAARWMERYDEAWHVHWHFGVDMAYHGWHPSNKRIARAIAPTRGEVLMYRGFPVLALFHASSGGRTEAFDVVKPDVFAPDGETPIAAAMPVAEDPAALPGAAGLKLEKTHGRWKADLPLPEVTQALQRWSQADARRRPRFGKVEGIEIATRQRASGRVGTVKVRHVLDGKRRFTTLAATDFRLAVSPVRIRSVWWDRCVIAAKPPGYLVLEGRGFGHGCGLSQTSAWHLAQQGEPAEAIVARFYAGARIERRY